MRNPAKKSSDAGNWKSPVRTDAFIFRARVNTAGYQWANGIMDGKPHLVPRFIPGTAIREFEPPKGVFAEFSETKPTREGIKTFANTYGDLFDSYKEPDHVEHDSTVSGGASLERWKSEIAWMRTLVELWQNIEKRRLGELEKIVRWRKTKDGNKEVGYVIKAPRVKDVTLAHSAISESGLSHFREGDVWLPAWCALQREINLQLEAHPTPPRLAWTPDYYQRIIFKQPNLLAAMWLKFAQAVVGEFQIKQCQVCGGYFQVGPGGKRADSTWCGDACKQKKWRDAHGK